jgi:hypothetical protein
MSCPDTLLRVSWTVFAVLPGVGAQLYRRRGDILAGLLLGKCLAQEGDDERYHDGEEHNSRPQSLRRGKPWRAPDPPIVRSRAPGWVISSHPIAFPTRPPMILMCGVDMKNPSGHFVSPKQSICVINVMPMFVTLYLGVCSGNSLLILEAEQERCQTRLSGHRLDGVAHFPRVAGESASGMQRSA